MFSRLFLVRVTRLELAIYTTAGERDTDRQARGCPTLCTRFRKILM